LILIVFDVRVGASLLVMRSPRAISPTLALKTVGGLLHGGWNWRCLTAIGVLGFPLVIAAALTSLTINIPRYFIEHFLGTAERGKFAALAYPMAAGITVINAIGQ